MKRIASDRPLFILLALAGSFFIPQNVSAQGGIDLARARQYFQEARALCEKDGGKLWGISLCSPILLVNPETRDVAASQADAEGKLTRQGEVFVGSFPQNENTGNTAMTWAGVKWTMLLWPLPEQDVARRALVAHELFHRAQEQLGMPMDNVLCAHLDSREGRIWLRLEWRALREALSSEGERRRKAILDAAVFRAQRRRLFERAASDEGALEMNEGLAEYTGLRLRGTPSAELHAYLAARLEQAEQRRSFVRQFAYETGPAYGLLLDASGAEWRKGLQAKDDLASLLATAFSLHLPEALGTEAEKRAGRYEGAALRSAELAREEEQQKREREYRARLMDAPVLVLPLSGEIGLSFDPYAVVSLGGTGTVYATLRVTAPWGILEVSGGALVTNKEGKMAHVCVPAPADPSARPLRGDGWKLELTPGWTLAPGERKGDFVLRKSE